ncbi:MAG: CPBP family intramembrane metalloprotease [Acidobacteria bacterium]|nr:CPBP family intramembrane metalloprotease [Acidobacteriota bacterium]
MTHAPRERDDETAPRERTAAPELRPVPDPDSPPWGFWEALGLLLVSFVLMLLTFAVFIIPYAVYRGVGLLAFGEFATKDPGALLVQVLSILPAHLLTLALAWLIVTRAGKHPFFRTLGWEWRAGFTFWRSAGLAVLLLLVGIGIAKLAGPTDNALEQLVRSSRAAMLAVAFVASVTAPLVEEVVFRGVLYSALRRLAGSAGAVVFVVLIFAVIHVPQYWPSYGVIATILLLSTVLTLIRARTGQLLPCFIVHLVFNSIQAVFMVLDPYIKRFAPDEAAPAPGLLVELVTKLFGG